MKRIISLILCLLMVSTMLVACKKKGEQNTETNTVSTAPIGNEDERIKPNIPENADLNAKNFVIYVQPWNAYAPLDITDICPVEEADAITEKAFERRYVTEEALNCTIEQYVGQSSYNKGLADLQAVLAAGDTAYDILMIRAKQYTGLIGSGYLTNIDDIPHIDMSKPWWDEKSSKALEISNKAFAICGDMTVNDDLGVFNIYFNKEMADNYRVTNVYGKDIYQIVKDREWTFDTMYAMAKLVVSHPDATGIPGNTSSDIYGFGYIQDASVAFLNSFGTYIATVNNDGVPEFTLDGEANITKMQKLLSVLQDTSTSINFHARRKETATKEETQTFLDNRELFCVGGIYYCSEMRKSETDFGIIPMPMYDKDQGDYNSPCVGTALTITAVPWCNPDLESTGIFMEYFAYEGYYTLRPALYDKLLNGQLARDVESLEMLDIIFANVSYDTGLIFNYNSIADEIFKSYNNLEDTISSNMVGYKKNVSNAITKLVLTLNSLEQ